MGPGRPRIGKQAQVAAGAGLAAGLYLWLTFRLAWVCDDAYIVGRYARHLAGGDGLRFNVDEPVPVEGYSDPLWVAIAAGLELAGARSPEVIGGVSAGCGLAVLAGVGLGARRVLGVGESAALSAVVALAALPPFVIWATSGLETMAATAAWLATSLAAAAACRPAGELDVGGLGGRGTGLREGSADAGGRAESAPGAQASAGGLEDASPRVRADLGSEAEAAAPGSIGAGFGVAAGALCLLRPEGPVFIVCLLAAVGLWAGRPALERLRRGVVGWCAVLVAWQALRLGWHQAWVANTVPAKLVFGPAAWLRGGMYLLLFAGAWVSPVVAAWAGLRAASRSTPARILGAAAVIPAVFAVAVGGDYLPAGRFVHASLPVLAVLGAAVLEGLPTPGRALATVSAVVLLGGLPLADVQVVPRPVLYRLQRAVGSRHPVFRSDIWSVQREAERSAARVRWARAIRATVPAGSSIVARGVGALGYETELYVLDAYGIVSPEVAERAVHGLGAAPGHDRLVQRGFFMGRTPDVLFAFVLVAGRRGQVVESFPPQWGVFEDLGPEHPIYVAELVHAPLGEGSPPDDLMLIRALRPGEDPQALRDAFREACERSGYKAPPLEPLDERRRAIAIEKRRGGARIQEMLDEAGHKPEGARRAP
jgi:hypothetical protein